MLKTPYYRPRNAADSSDEDEPTSRPIMPVINRPSVPSEPDVVDVVDISALEATPLSAIIPADVTTSADTTGVTTSAPGDVTISTHATNVTTSAPDDVAISTHATNVTTAAPVATGPNFTLEFPAIEMKKTIARHIACAIVELSRRQCLACEIDDPSQFHHDCMLPDDILIYMHFDEAVEAINSTAVMKDWLCVLLDAGLKLSDLTSDHLCAIGSWLQEPFSEEWRNKLKQIVLAVMEDDL